MKVKTPLMVLLAVAGLAIGVAYRGKWFNASSPSESARAMARKGQDPNEIQGPYFSDRDRIGATIIAAIGRTRQSLDIAVYSFTDRRLEAAVVAAARRGVRVRVVADENQATESHSEIFYLRAAHVPVRLSGGYRGQRSIMHDKFAVFDDQWVETGSFNWTISAEDYNYENAIFISDPSTVARYEREFERIWSRAE